MDFLLCQTLTASPAESGKAGGPPLVGFSLAMCATRSWRVRRRPRLRRLINVYLRATNSRCQRNSVSGVTMEPKFSLPLASHRLRLLGKVPALGVGEDDAPAAKFARGADDSLHSGTRSPPLVAGAASRRPSSAGIAADLPTQPSHPNAGCSFFQRQSGQHNRVYPASQAEFRNITRNPVDGRNVLLQARPCRRKKRPARMPVDFLA